MAPLGTRVLHFSADSADEKLRVGVDVRDRVGDDRLDAGDALGLRRKVRIGRRGHGQPDLREDLDDLAPRLLDRLDPSVREVIVCGDDQVLLFAGGGTEGHSAAKTTTISTVRVLLEFMVQSPWKEFRGLRIDIVGTPGEVRGVFARRSGSPRESLWACRAA